MRGFFASIVDKIGIPEVSQRLMTTIEGRLAEDPTAAPAAQPVEEN